MRKKLIRIMSYVYCSILIAAAVFSLVYLNTEPFLQRMPNIVNISLATDQETTKDSYQIENTTNKKTWSEEGTAQTEPANPDIGGISSNEVGAGASESEHTVDIKEIQYPELGTHYATLSCEQIQLEVPVCWGDTTDILDTGVGQFMGSFLPGFDRCILLSAHNTTFFKPLEQIEVGDIVVYNTNYGEYRYIVDQLIIINADDAEKMLNRLLGLAEETLIMYTCYPFKPTVRNKDKRLFVLANKQLGPRVIMK